VSLSEVTHSVEEAAAERARLGRALATSDEGIIVVDAAGYEVVRSDAAERFRNARHGDAVAQELIERLLRGALDGV
jgi:PAS domain-containing protein